MGKARRHRKQTKYSKIQPDKDIPQGPILNSNNNYKRMESNNQPRVNWQNNAQ